MIYILQETVIKEPSTPFVFITGVEAKSFVHAIERVKDFSTKKGIVLTSEQYSSKCWQYVIQPKKGVTPCVLTHGVMSDEPIHMLE